MGGSIEFLSKHLSRAVRKVKKDFRDVQNALPKSRKQTLEEQLKASGMPFYEAPKAESISSMAHKTYTEINQLAQSFPEFDDGLIVNFNLRNPFTSKTKWEIGFGIIRESETIIFAVYTGLYNREKKSNISDYILTNTVFAQRFVIQVGNLEYNEQLIDGMDLAKLDPVKIITSEEGWSRSSAVANWDEFNFNRNKFLASLGKCRELAELGKIN